MLAAGVIKAEIFFSFHYTLLLLRVYNSVSITFLMFKVILFRSYFYCKNSFTIFQFCLKKRKMCLSGAVCKIVKNPTEAAQNTDYLKLIRVKIYRIGRDVIAEN